MRTPRWLWSLFCSFGIAATFAGCTGEPAKQEEQAAESSKEATSEKEETSEKTAKSVKSDAGEPPKKEVEIPVQPADMPATLAELDAKAEWVEQPVRDTLKLLREKQAKEQPIATAEEALALKNTSREINAKLASALGRVATDDSQVDYEATFNRHSRIDINSSNPIMGQTVADFDINGLTMFGLLSFDWNMEPLATSDTVLSWHTSKDRLMDKVVLRDDLTWSDGKPITAHDVVFSFLTIMNPKVPIPAVRSGTDQIKWVHAYDDRTVVYFHKAALATNVWSLNFPAIPKHIYQESVEEDPTLKSSDHHVKYEESPVVGGPYNITRRARGQEIVLTRRESWYMHNGKQVRDKPYFKEVRFRIMEDPNIALLALKNGEIDEVELTPEQWMTQTTGSDFYEHNTKVSGPEWTYFQFLWNLREPQFSDLKTRQALAYAFDYKEMLDKLFYGLYEQSNGIFAPGAWMAPKNPQPYYHRDLDKAEQLLTEAGWEDSDGDGILDREVDGQRVKFEFTLFVPNIPERIKLCTLLKENLAQIGIDCNVRPVEFAVLTQKMMGHEFQAAFGGWGTGADPDTSENVWGTGEMRNYNFYSNSEVDRLFAEGRKEFDRAKRGEIYGRIAELIYADQPSTFLFLRNSFFAFNKRLRGYNFSPRGPYHYGPGISSIYKVKP